MNDLPYSYHTFLFPFIWNDRGKTGIGEFKEKLNPNWVKSAFADVSDKEAHSCDYAKYQYFTPAMRELVFPDHSDRSEPITHNYAYTISGNPVHQNAHYVIKKTYTNKETNEKITECFKLTVDGIKLRVFNSGVAILSFELEYHGDKDGKKVPFSLDDINKINEHGRRICLPYIGTVEAPCVLTADSIELRFEGTSFLTDYNKTISKFENDNKPPVLTHIMDPISSLLGNFTSNPGKVTPDKPIIYPAVDDRMFVCCLIRSDTALMGLSDWCSSGEYSYLCDCERENHQFSDTLYKTIYIENSVSCVSRSMKKSLLKESIYDRWIDEGTLYGVTHHSLMCITGESCGLRAAVYNPFLTQYVEMASTALAQRATILALSVEASQVAIEVSKEERRKSKKRESLEIIENLQKKYVQAQNQIMLFEITAQEQGVEIFNRLMEQLYIKENKRELDDQMNNLREIADIINARMERTSDEKNNCLLTWIAIIGGVLGLASLIVSLVDLFCC